MGDILHYQNSFALNQNYPSCLFLNLSGLSFILYFYHYSPSLLAAAVKVRNLILAKKYFALMVIVSMVAAYAMTDGKGRHVNSLIFQVSGE